MSSVHRTARRRARREDFVHDDQPFGIHVGKGPEDDLVEHAEEGGRRANPAREDQHGEDRERGRSPQGTPRLAHIMRDGFEHRGSFVTKLRVKPPSDDERSVRELHY